MKRSAIGGAVMAWSIVAHWSPGQCEYHTLDRDSCDSGRAASDVRIASAPEQTMMPIDLRSDTVTQPSPGMREAMARAEVGDDVFAGDPTVNRLQELCAERFGMEAGLFFPSGTQSNLAALMAHCQRGEEVIVGQDAHTYHYEAGGMAVLGSIQPQPLTNRPDGSLDLVEVEAAIKPDDSHFAITRLLALENTIGGKVLSRRYMADALALAKRRKLSTH